MLLSAESSRPLLLLAPNTKLAQIDAADASAGTLALTLTSASTEEVADEAIDEVADAALLLLLADLEGVFGVLEELEVVEGVAVLLAFAVLLLAFALALTLSFAFAFALALVDVSAV